MVTVWVFGVIGAGTNMTFYLCRRSSFIVFYLINKLVFIIEYLNELRQIRHPVYLLSLMYFTQRSVDIYNFKKRYS